MLSKQENKVVTAGTRTATGELSALQTPQVLDETGDLSHLPDTDNITADVRQAEGHEDCGECWGECRF
ncbi:MAG: hypothetical protein GEU73_01080 [Chloroflexi bacterium]|nr:hypothetical protein [Chloroflexota bacterium]